MLLPSVASLQKTFSNNPDLEIVDGSFENWMSRSDAALVGQTFAQRRALQTGDQFEAVGVNVYVAGIIKSDEAQDNNVAYVHLPFLQQASKIGLWNGDPVQRQGGFCRAP